MNKSNNTTNPKRILKSLCQHKTIDCTGEIVSALTAFDVEDNMLVSKCSVCGGIVKRRLFTAEEVDQMLTMYNIDATYNRPLINDPEINKEIMKIDLKLIEAHKGMMNVIKKQKQAAKIN